MIYLLAWQAARQLTGFWHTHILSRVSAVSRQYTLAHAVCPVLVVGGAKVLLDSQALPKPGLYLGNSRTSSSENMHGYEAIYGV